MTSPLMSELQEKDRAHHVHPFTNHNDMHSVGSHVLVKGEGCHLIDANGGRLLDGLAGLWCVNVGYSCQPIIDAVHRQMQELPYYPSFFNSTTEPPVRVAEFLAQRAPKGLDHVVFSGSGSEANETALKTIRGYHKIKGNTRKKKILTRTFAYHGVTLATTSMTGLPSCYEPFDLPLENFIQVPGPYTYGAKTDLDPESYGKWCIEQTAKKIREEGADTIAAIFAEPIQGAGGVIVPPAGYLQELRALARENDILFVADEVITAFGRLGSWFASGLWDLQPDIITVAKGLTSGYLPFGATILSNEIVDTIFTGGYYAHGYTYTGHPTCAAAALANLQTIESLGLIEKVRDETGPLFQAGLKELAEHPAVSEARGYGLIGALEVIPQGGREALTPTTMLGVKAAALVREEGVIVRGIRDLIAMAPPLIITPAEIKELFDGVRRGLDRLWK